MPLKARTPYLRVIQDTPRNERIDYLQRAADRALDEWEFIWRLVEQDKSLRDNQTWRNLQEHLAHRADMAFHELMVEKGEAI